MAWRYANFFTLSSFLSPLSFPWIFPLQRYQKEMNQESVLWLALSRVPGLPGRVTRSLIKEERPLSSFFRLSRKSLQSLRLPEKSIGAIVGGSAIRAAEQELRQLPRLGLQLVTLDSPRYPRLLRQIHDPPPVLYCAGRVETLSGPSVALVGSRRPTVYGKEVSRKLARELSALGLCVVSGLARGIDSEAHWGALQEEGRTIGVLGCGIDVVYPPENGELFRRVREQGCLVSEFPRGSPPVRHHFPARNRIISGLAHGTVVAQAAKGSGSIITANLALEQGRDVWAVPGAITLPLSWGPNWLIQQGAKLVLSVQDVLEELPRSVLERLEKENAEPSPAPQPTAGEEEVLNLLTVDSTLHIDAILEKTGLDLSRLSDILLSLELKSLIRQSPGRQYSRRLS